MLGVIVVPAVVLTLLALIVMSGPTTTLKTFKETEMIATARILVSLFVLFFMFKN
jgi:hypothetical protein